MRRHTIVSTFALGILASLSCGGGDGASSATQPPPPPPPPPQTPTVASIVIAPSPVDLEVGETISVTATVRDGDGNPMSSKTVRWRTSDATVVGGLVNGNTAMLEGIGPGSATVTADVDGVTGTLPVTVHQTTPKPVASVMLSPASSTIALGATLPIVATLRDAQGRVLTGRVVTWTTSDPNVATGVSEGNVAVVQGVGVGVAIIRATSEGVSGDAIVTVVSSGGTPIPLTCLGLAGGVIFAQDGEYLGRLTNRFDSESILNPFGPHGSEFSSRSIYNPYGRYGSPFSNLSAYNEFTSTPPQLYVSAQFAAYVTKNTFRTPRVDPDALRSCDFP